MASAVRVSDRRGGLIKSVHLLHGERSDCLELREASLQRVVAVLLGHPVHPG